MITVSGILVQLPLPKHIDKQKVIEAIDPSKRCRWISSNECRQPFVWL